MAASAATESEPKYVSVEERTTRIRSLLEPALYELASDVAQCGQATSVEVERLTESTMKYLEASATYLKALKETRQQVVSKALPQLAEGSKELLRLFAVIETMEASMDRVHEAIDENEKRYGELEGIYKERYPEASRLGIGSVFGGLFGTGSAAKYEGGASGSAFGLEGSREVEPWTPEARARAHFSATDASLAMQEAADAASAPSRLAELREHLGLAPGPQYAGGGATGREPESRPGADGYGGSAGGGSAGDGVASGDEGTGPGGASEESGDGEGPSEDIASDDGEGPGDVPYGDSGAQDEASYSSD